MVPESFPGSDHHPVFVYGTLRQGLSNHHLLAAARCVGPAQTRHRYALYVDSYPKVVAQEAVAAIHGEVYLVDGYTLALLDDLEDHPFTYRRQQVPVLLADGEEIMAWLYFHPQPSGVLVPTGDLAACLQGEPEED